MNQTIDHLFTTSPAICAMLGVAELLVILIVFALFAGVVVTVVLLAVKAGRSRDTPPPPGMQATTEARLLELDSMLSAGTITKSEHAEQRQRILDSV